MSKVLSVAKWSFDLLAKRIASLRIQKVFPVSRIYGESAYEEAQMLESDASIRMQKAELDYDCWSVDGLDDHYGLILFCFRQSEDLKPCTWLKIFLFLSGEHSDPNEPEDANRYHNHEKLLNDKLSDDWIHCFWKALEISTNPFKKSVWALSGAHLLEHLLLPSHV